MLTDEQLEVLGDRIAGLYQEFEQDVIADIARRVKRTGRFTETAELMAQAMYENGASPAKIREEVMKILNADRVYQEEVAKNTLEWKNFVKDEIEKMEQAAEQEGNRIIADAGDMSFNYDMAVWEQAGKKLTKDSAFARMIEEMSLATAGTLKNLTGTTGFKGAHDFTSIQNAYIKSLDKALLKMTAGAFSYDQAVNDCIKELAKSGLRCVEYASGRTYQLDTAARMCIRTSCHQLSGKISMRNCEITGTDLVEVSAHWGARPDHAAWQGKIYSRSGKNKKYPSFSICRYGEVDGLMGVNCRHAFYPFFEGISTPNEWEAEPKPKNYKGKTYNYYDATQKQRQMERNIRATKREIEAQREIGGDTSALQSKLRSQTSEYHSFSKAVDIRAKDNRLKVVAGSSNVKKSVKSKGALNNKNDPTGRKRNDFAKSYYESIRNSKSEYIVEKIAKNTEMDAGKVSQAIDHLFYKEYNLTNGYGHFDEDYYIAQSVQRLRSGKDIQEHDLILIEHENYEYDLMNNQNMSYIEAHKIAESKYNYSKALDEFLEKESG